METASGAHRDSQQMSQALAPSALSPRSLITGPPLQWTGSQLRRGPPQLFVDPLVSGIAVNMVSMSALSMTSAEGRLGPRDFAQAISWKITTSGLVCSISGGCVHTSHICAYCNRLIRGYMLLGTGNADFGSADFGESCLVSAAKLKVEELILPCHRCCAPTHSNAAESKCQTKTYQV